MTQAIYVYISKATLGLALIQNLKQLKYVTDVKPLYRSMGIKLLQLRIFAVSYLFLHLVKNLQCCHIRSFNSVYW